MSNNDGGFCPECDTWSDDFTWGVNGECPECGHRLRTSPSILSRRESAALLAENLASIRRQMKEMKEKEQTGTA